MAKQYRSKALAVVHETALGLYEAGVVDRRTMREFDALCLTPAKALSPKQIRSIRLREKAGMSHKAVKHTRREKRKPRLSPQGKRIMAALREVLDDVIGRSGPKWRPRSKGRASPKATGARPQCISGPP